MKKTGMVFGLHLHKVYQRQPAGWRCGNTTAVGAGRLEFDWSNCTALPTAHHRRCDVSSEVEAALPRR